jgi:hypothetical protein
VVRQDQAAGLVLLLDSSFWISILLELFKQTVDQTGTW